MTLSREPPRAVFDPMIYLQATANEISAQLSEGVHFSYTAFLKTWLVKPLGDRI